MGTTLFWNGKKLDVGKSFDQLKIINGSKLAMICPGGDGKVKQWVRFSRFRYCDYYYMYYNNWECICFVPEKNIKLHGFGIFAHYNNRDVKHTVKWGTDGNFSSEHKVEFSDSDKDPDKKWWTFNLKDVGEKPYKVAAGERLHIFLKPQDEDSRRCWYEYEDSEYAYRNLD